MFQANRGGRGKGGDKNNLISIRRKNFFLNKSVNFKSKLCLSKINSLNLVILAQNDKKWAPNYILLPKALCLSCTSLKETLDNLMVSILSMSAMPENTSLTFFQQIEIINIFKYLCFLSTILSSYIPKVFVVWCLATNPIRQNVYILYLKL